MLVTALSLGALLTSALTWLVQLRDLFYGFSCALNAREQTNATGPADATTVFAFS